MAIDYWELLEKAVARKDTVAVIILANTLRKQIPPGGIPVQPPALKSA